MTIVPLIHVIAEPHHYLECVMFCSQQVRIPMHLIPNIALGKVSNRSVTRVFFPRMYPLGAREVGQEELAQIYDHCVRPVMLEIAMNPLPTGLSVTRLASASSRKMQVPLPQEPLTYLGSNWKTSPQSPWKSWHTLKISGMPILCTKSGG